MRYAVLSDIHSNLEALEAVLTDAGAQSCDQYVCLGDVVGYNANPSECVKRIQDLGCRPATHVSRSRHTIKSDRCDRRKHHSVARWAVRRVDLDLANVLKQAVKPGSTKNADLGAWGH